MTPYGLAFRPRDGAVRICDYSQKGPSLTARGIRVYPSGSLNGTETRASCWHPPHPSASIATAHSTDQDLPSKPLAMESPQKSYPGHDLSTLQLLHALRIRLEQGELLE